MIRRRGSGSSGAMASRASGEGRTVVLCHGVAVGPDSFDRMVELLVGDHRVVVAVRPGYDGADDDAAEFDDQVVALSGLLAAQSLPGVLVGVGAGATLGLALAVGAAHAPELDGWRFLLHEPLLGPVQRDLHRAAIDEVEHLRNPTREDVRAFAATLARGSVEAVDADPGTIAADARTFTSFAPSSEALAAIPIGRVTTSVGEDQPQARRAAADLLADLAGAGVEVVPGAAHLPQLQAPGAFADLVRRLAA